MEINLNSAQGGDLKTGQNFRKVTINIRKHLKECLSGFESEGLEKMKYFICINGHLTKYYDESGLYKPKYFQKRKEFMVDICLDDKLWVKDESKNEELFVETVTKLLIKSADILGKRLSEKDLTFDIESFKKIIQDCLK